MKSFLNNLEKAVSTSAYMYHLRMAVFSENFTRKLKKYINSIHNSVRKHIDRPTYRIIESTVYTI